jgi:hypothetical protein
MKTHDRGFVLNARLFCDDLNTAIRMPNRKPEYLSNSDLLCLDFVRNYIRPVK